MSWWSQDWTPSPLLTLRKLIDIINSKIIRCTRDIIPSSHIKMDFDMELAHFWKENVIQQVYETLVTIAFSKYAKCVFIYKLQMLRIFWAWKWPKSTCNVLTRVWASLVILCMIYQLPNQSPNRKRPNRKPLAFEVSKHDIRAQIL